MSSNYRLLIIFSLLMAFIGTLASQASAGPQISPLSLSITSPEQYLQLKVTDSTGAYTCTAQVEGFKGQSFKIASKTDLIQIRPEGGWPYGAHRVKVEAVDQSGSQTVQHYWVVVAAAPSQRFEWVPNKGIFDGSSYFFPLGIFHVWYDGMERVKAAGFNLVHHYIWEDYPDDDGAREYLDAAHALGLKVFMGFDRGLISGEGLVQMNLAHLAERVAKLRDHPALLAWYLFDEPDHDHQYISPRNLKILYDTLKGLDPYHPVVVTFAWPDSLAYYGTDCFDAYWIVAYGEAAENDVEITRDTAALGPDKTYLVVNRSYDQNKSDRLQRGRRFSDDNFIPDKPRMRAEAYLSLARGSSGLCWWWYTDYREAFVAVGDTPEAWGWLSQVMAELNQLVPVLNGSGYDLTVEVEDLTPGPMVRARAIQNGSQITLIAVNTSTSQEAQVAIKSQHFPSGATAFGKFDTPSNQISNRELRVTLPPLAAYVYEVYL